MPFDSGPMISIPYKYIKHADFVEKLALFQVDGPVFLSIDPGSSNMGWAIRSKPGKYSASGSFNIPESWTLSARLRVMFEAAFALFSTVRPLKAVIEIPEPFSYKVKRGSPADDFKKRLGFNVNDEDSSRGLRGILTLSEVIGAIKSAAILSGFPESDLLEVSPQVWKGKESKKTTQARTGTDNPDQADALGILAWYLDEGGRMKPTTAYNRRRGYSKPRKKADKWPLS